MEKKQQDLSDKRLALIKKLINLAYTYSGNTELFHRKFTEMISITSLQDLEVIEMNDNIYQLPVSVKLTNEELVIYNLSEQGFTPQEISMICNIKSINAVYIKRHRIKKNYEVQQNRKLY